MEFIKKSMKVVIVCFILFIILTFISAAVLYLSNINESWSHGMMLTAMAISALFAGVLEAKIVGRRMIFVFLITVILFSTIVYGSVYMLFSLK